MKLSIIIPVYNEEKTINEILGKVTKISLPHRLKKEIIVVDDASFDNTTKILKQWLKRGLKYIRHTRNQGKGAAVKTGLRAATGDFVIIQDADLEYDPNDYIKLFQPILDEKADVVYGNRFENYPLKFWGNNKTILPTYWIGNMILATVTNLLYGSALRDMETCYKLLSKRVLDKIDLKAGRFEIEAEITAKVLKSGMKIYEVSITVAPRTHKEGKKISWKDGFIAIWTLIKYRFVD